MLIDLAQNFLWWDCATKDSHFTKTLISKISSKPSIAFEQHKSNPSSLGWSTSTEPLRRSADGQATEERQRITTLGYFLLIHHPTRHQKPRLASTQILELVRHESRITHIKIKCLHVQKCLYFLRAIFLYNSHIPGVST